MTRFWRKRKGEEVSSQGSVPVAEWGVGEDFLPRSGNPLKRSQKLLVEIQKRCLAEQVLLLSWDVHKEQSRVRGVSPLGDTPVVDSQLQESLLEKVREENRVFFWEDLWEDIPIREKLKRAKYDTLLLFPLNREETLTDALLLVNYSTWGDPARVTEFVTSISPLIALSLQNTNLYEELKKKNIELEDWTAHVEERIEEGTKKLLEKDYQYYTLFEGANDGIVVHDVSGRLLEVNGAICRLLGYDKKELLNVSWDRLTVSDALIKQRVFFEKVAKKVKVPRLETVLRRKDGSVFQAELSSRQVRFQGNRAIQTIIRDIAVRKMLEESLREAKKKYRILVESSLVGVFIIRSGVIQFVNTMFEEITGYPKENLLENNFFDLIAPEDRALVKERETQREKGERAPDHYEVRFLKRSKDKCWGEVRSRRIVLDGRPAVLGNVIDVTQRKQLAKQLLETQKMESIATLASGIAHDFNNLLGGILGYASLLLNDMPDDHPYYEDVRAISETAKRAAELTSHLLAYARGGKYRVATLNMNRIVEDVIGVISRTKEPSVTIETLLDKDLKPIRGDSRQLHQAILNVCLNALEALPGRGKITIATGNQILDESFAQDELGISPGEYVCISVVDTGAGMDEKTKSRMFEPFFTTKLAGEGSGLGLALVYGVVKNHDGAVMVETALGKGTKVILYLPLYEEEEGVQGAKRLPKKGKAIRVLLVDDEKTIREVGKRMLEKKGFEVILASNGKEAVDIYRKNGGAIDLVVMDLVMPVMGGKESYRRLRSIDAGVRVVFTSGYTPYDRPGFTDIQEKSFLQKPFQTEALIRTVRRALGCPERDQR